MARGSRSTVFGRSVSTGTDDADGRERIERAKGGGHTRHDRRCHERRQYDVRDGSDWCAVISANRAIFPARPSPACRSSNCRPSPPGPLLAIVISGDGGWRDLDRTIAEKLRSQGVSVVGWDSLRYFWSRKTPAQVARDLGAVIDTYTARWGASKVALVGYSFGAGVLPFAYDRLPPEAKQRVVQLSLLGFDSAADFEISMMGWLGAPPTENALPTKPALAPIDPSMIQCFYGRDDGDSLCPLLAKTDKAEVIETQGGHHFDGDYDALAEDILKGFRRRAG